MKSLTMIEIIALVFTAVAAGAAVMQSYVIWETRGEVARMIVFSERIEACAETMAALRPFTAETGPDGQERVAGGQSSGRYSLPAFFYRTSAGNPAFDAAHEPRLDRWRLAKARFDVVMPDDARETAVFLDRAIDKDIAEGAFMSQAEMLDWMRTFEQQAEGLAADCRRYSAPARAADA